MDIRHPRVCTRHWPRITALITPLGYYVSNSQSQQRRRSGLYRRPEIGRSVLIAGLCQQLCPKVTLFEMSGQVTSGQVGLDDKLPVN